MRCKCGEEFEKQKNSFWDERGTFSVKYAKCPKCSSIYMIYPQELDEKNLFGLKKEKDPNNNMLNFEDKFYISYNISNRQLILNDIIETNYSLSLFQRIKIIN